MGARVKETAGVETKDSFCFLTRKVESRQNMLYIFKTDKTRAEDRGEKKEVT